MTDGYRALPATIPDPSLALRRSSAEMESLSKSKLHVAPSRHRGHASTTVWYAPKVGYILEVAFDNLPTVYIQSICTFTPTLGMDAIDEAFAEDAEAQVIAEALGIRFERLDIFSGNPHVPVETYLRIRGLLV